jgi:hypothetical protein
VVLTCSVSSGGVPAKLTDPSHVRLAHCHIASFGGSHPALASLVLSLNLTSPGLCTDPSCLQLTPCEGKGLANCWLYFLDVTFLEKWLKRSDLAEDIYVHIYTYRYLYISIYIHIYDIYLYLYLYLYISPFMTQWQSWFYPKISQILLQSGTMKERHLALWVLRRYWLGVLEQYLLGEREKKYLC